MHTDETAIKELEQTIMKYKRTVYGIAMTQLKNKHEADDVCRHLLDLRRLPLLVRGVHLEGALQDARLRRV